MALWRPAKVDGCFADSREKNRRSLFSGSRKRNLPDCNCAQSKPNAFADTPSTSTRERSISSSIFAGILSPDLSTHSKSHTFISPPLATVPLCRRPPHCPLRCDIGRRRRRILQAWLRIIRLRRACPFLRESQAVKEDLGSRKPQFAAATGQCCACCNSARQRHGHQRDLAEGERGDAVLATEQRLLAPRGAVEIGDGLRGGGRGEL